MVLIGDETSTGFPYRALYRTTYVLTHGQLSVFILALALTARDYLCRVDKAMSAQSPSELRELLHHLMVEVQIFL
jgi:hypothetical protein